MKEVAYDVEVKGGRNDLAEQNGLGQIFPR